VDKRLDFVEGVLLVSVSIAILLMMTIAQHFRMIH
jgi:hypothetical protein